MSRLSETPSLTPSRSPSPPPPVQPDHFYGDKNIDPQSPNSDGRTCFDPEDDPLAQRGIPVFKPTMEEFRDFEAYMTKVECWGVKSGIVKVIPPKEWTDSLPSLNKQLVNVKIKSPIEQHMLGSGGLFRQQNMEKRRLMSVREWSELCSKADFKAPGLNDIGLHARSNIQVVKPRRGKKRTTTQVAETAEPEVATPIKNDAVGVDMDDLDEEGPDEPPTNPQPNGADIAETSLEHDASSFEPVADDKVQEPIGSGSPPAGLEGDAKKPKPKRAAQSRESREANLADRAARDAEFLKTFNPHGDWLPDNTSAADYTFEFCQKLERQFWRNCGLGRPAWYGADTQGSLYTDATTCWNVGHLPSALSRLLPSSLQGVPGVNTPYLYFGMWRATFAWHVEDMDLFSINYIHFGAPKFWYAVPQGRASALESTMRSYFPGDTSKCPQFLRHKSFLASPKLLAQASCKPNILVQKAGEFVITFPKGYHAGFNLGFNCAESINFALDSWLELGKKAKVCECTSDSVRIDVEQLLKEKEQEVLLEDGVSSAKSESPRKRKEGGDISPRPKKVKSATTSSPTTSGMGKVVLTLKLGPRPDMEPFVCCLCVSMEEEGLLRVHDPPIGRVSETSDGKWMAHEQCANVIPETWVDEVEVEDGGQKRFEKMVFGVDAIVKDRWNLRCSACSKMRQKAHGAPIQCTKGKCPKAFHVSCARNGAAANIIFNILREVEKDVVLLDSATLPKPPPTGELHSDRMDVDAVEAEGTAPNPSRVESPLVLKVIKKLEVMCLCPQHNPAVTAAKKANKQDKIRKDLLALPAMAPIKIRVSSGVFEVTLLRVIEETGSVEVLWDKGNKREFKWGSVVFGNTEAQQRPTEHDSAPDRATSQSSLPGVSHSSTAASESESATQTNPPKSTFRSHPSHYFPYTYPSGVTGYAAGSWTYQYQHSQRPNADSSQRNPYTAYYGASQFPFSYSAGQYRWQQPYTGPQPGSVASYIVGGQPSTISEGGGDVSAASAPMPADSPQDSTDRQDSNSTEATSVPATNSKSDPSASTPES